MNDASSAVIAAAILAGGNSQRMGEDKAALGDGGASLIERQVKDLRDLSQSLPIFICSGSRRYEALNTYDVQHVPDALNSAGPLAGVAKALETATAAGLEEGYVLVLPTDSLIPPSHIYDRLTGAVSGASEVFKLAHANTQVVGVSLVPGINQHPLFRHRPADSHRIATRVYKYKVGL